MPARAIGDLHVSAIGMGGMTLTQLPNADIERGVRAVHAAVDAGITLFDTADSYGEEHGLAFLAWGPLGGMRAAKGLGGAVAAAAVVAERHDVSPQLVTLAWLRSRSPVLIPILGASRPESVRDSAASADLVLDGDDLFLLDGRPGEGQ